MSTAVEAVDVEERVVRRNEVKVSLDPASDAPSSAFTASESEVINVTRLSTCEVVVRKRRGGIVGMSEPGAIKRPRLPCKHQDWRPYCTCTTLAIFACLHQEVRHATVNLLAFPRS